MFESWYDNNRRDRDTRAAREEQERHDALAPLHPIDIGGAGVVARRDRFEI